MASAICFTIGGSSGSGKGEVSGAMCERLGIELGPKFVELFDQGATYRASVWEALKDGATTEDEVVAHALSMIDANEPLEFLARFNEVWSDPVLRRELRTPQVSSLVAAVGELDDAQIFFTDILNDRIVLAVSQGVKAIVVDSRTPEVLIRPCLDKHVVTPAASLYMFTSSETAATWASQKPGATMTYEELLISLKARNRKDAMRATFPNTDPERNSRITMTAKNFSEILNDAREGRVDLSTSMLYVENDGGIPKYHLHGIGSKIVEIALTQTTL